MPDELVAAARERGHGALALTDHNSLSGSMEFAQAARGLGLRAIHGAEIDLDDGRHLTLLVETAAGWSNLSRLLTRAHAHTRERRPGPPGRPHVSLDAVLEHSEGLVCLTGCAAAGVEDEPTARRLLGAFGRERLRVELQRPYWQDDRARSRRRAALARAAGSAVRGHRQRPRPLAPARPAAGRAGGRAPAHHAGRLRAPAARQPLPRPDRPGGDGRALRRPPRRGGRDRAPGRAPAIRPDPEPRLPLPRRRGPRRRPPAGPAVPPGAGHALRRRPQPLRGRRRGWTRS